MTWGLFRYPRISCWFYPAPRLARALPSISSALPPLTSRGPPAIAPDRSVNTRWSSSASRRFRSRQDQSHSGQPRRCLGQPLPSSFPLCIDVNVWYHDRPTALLRPTTGGFGARKAEIFAERDRRRERHSQRIHHIINLLQGQVESKWSQTGDFGPLTSEKPKAKGHGSYCFHGLYRNSGGWI